MSHIDFFQSQIDCLPHFVFRQVSGNGKNLSIEVPNQDKTKQNYKFGFDDFFQIRNKIRGNLAELQSIGATEEVQKQLEVFKNKLVKKIKEDRGWFSSMSEEETTLLNAYFAEAHAILAYKPGIVRRFLSGAFKVGVVGALAYGTYRYFGQ